MNVNFVDRHIDRRGLLRCGLSAAGVLLGTSAARALPFMRSYLPQPIMPAEPITPTQVQPQPSSPATLTFEVGSGINPHLMARTIQDYLAATMSPEYAAGIGQVQAVRRTAQSFHMQFRSDYVIQNPLQPTRNRFNHLLSIEEVIRVDAQSPIRPQQDLNFFEMRRLIHQSELNQFGLVLFPNSMRQAPTPVDHEAFLRIARRLYGVPSPEQFTVLYTRVFTDGRSNFMGFLAARGPEPLRSAYKDLLIDPTPF